MRSGARRPGSGAGPGRRETRHPAPVTRHRRQPARLAFWAILALAAAIRLVSAITLDTHPLLQPVGTLDAAAYVDLARRVAAGDWLLSDGRAFYVSPLYLYFLALVFAIAGSSSLLAARLVQALLGAAAVALLGDVARRWSGPRAGTIAALLAAVCGTFVFYEIQILQASLDVVLTALGAWLLTRALHDGGARWWAATGAALGLHVLNRPNMLAWAVIAPGTALVSIAWWRQNGRAGAERTGRWAPLVALLAAAAVVAPVSLRNYAAAGELTLVTSHGGLNFYIGNHAGADGTYRIVPGITPSIEGQARDARQVASAALGRPVTDGETSRYFTDQALAWIWAQPRAALALFLRKLAYTVNAIELSLNGSYAFLARDEMTVLTFLPVGPWLLLPLGLVGLWIGYREQDRPRERAAWLAWTMFVPVYAVSVALFFVSGRYRLPLLVMSIVPAAVVLTAVATAAGRRNWTKAGGLAAAVVAAAAVTNWPTGLDDGRSADRTEMVLARIAEGRTSEALELLKAWEATHPARGLLLYRTGVALRERGEAEHAVTVLQHARQVEGDRPEIWLALGQALLDAGRAAEAAPHLGAALAAGVRPDLAGFDLARAQVALGDRGAARDALAQVPPALDAPSARAAGELARDLGDPVLAQRFLSRVVALEPADAAAHEALGVALALQQRRREAIDALETACRLDPARATARLNLAVLYADEGRIEEARTLGEEALRLRPDYARARAFLEELDKAVGGGR